MNILDKGLMSWISKNKYTFMLVVLLAGNIYQYIDRKSSDNKYFEESKRLNTLIKDMGEQSLLYERQRSEKLEFLFNNLSHTKK